VNVTLTDDKWRGTIIVGVLMLVLGAGLTQFWSVVVGGAARQQNVIGLERELAQARADLSDASDNVVRLQERISGLERDIKYLTQSIAELKSQVSELRKELQLLRSSE